jgi:solute:Na+ symporter, SSS family
VLGMFSKRVNSRGAFVGLLVGFVAGMTKLTLQTLTQSGVIGGEGILSSIGRFNGYYACGWLTLLSILTIVFVSLTSPAPCEEKLNNITFRTISPAKRAEWKQSITIADWLGTLLVLGIIIAGYVYFSFWLN